MADARLIGYEQLQARFRALGGSNTGIMRDLALAAKNEIGNLTPVKTGNLRRSLDIADVRPTSAKVVAKANYALFVEEDTKPHEITPVAKKALRWANTAAGRNRTGSPNAAALKGKLGLGKTFGGFAGVSIKRVGSVGAHTGPISFAKSVHHPGTTGQHFMMNGAKKAVGSVGLDAIVKAWNKR